MPTMVLTDRAVKNAKPPEGGRLEIWDSVIGQDATLPGAFGLRVTPRGVKSWVVMYRVNGKQTRMTLGTFPAFGLAEARAMAREALQMAGRGDDPARMREAARKATAGARTTGQEIRQFIERYAKPKNRSWRETERIFEYYVIPRIGDVPLEQVRRVDIVELLDGIVDQGRPYMANRVLAGVRRFFNWTVERGALDLSPASQIKAPAKEVSRDRVLSQDEIGAIWLACEEIGWPFGPLFQLLLVTAQRRDEVAHMRWSNVDLDRMLWTIPREGAKSDRAHDVPLSPRAVAILHALPRTGDLTFSTNRRTPVSGFSRAKRRCDELSGVSGWRLHDLRRTAASGMAGLEVPPYVVEKVLNHTQGQISGVAAVYNRYGYSSEKADALLAWSKAMDGIVGSGATQLGLAADSPANVVKLHA